MNVLAKYYEKNLYPLQNGVLSIVEKCGTPFFLTGGTALSRFYTHHRYSDDLDFFVIDESAYTRYVTKILENLIVAEANGLFRLDRNSLNRGRAYTQLFIRDAGSGETELKVEFINDVSAHYGAFAHDPILGRIDSLRNILSNKLTALFRSEPKDAADIYAITTQRRFTWKEIVSEAKSKEAAADPETIYDILNSFPVKYLDTIKWITRPNTDVFRSDIHTIADDILLGRNNSLAPPNALQL